MSNTASIKIHQRGISQNLHIAGLWFLFMSVSHLMICWYTKHKANAQFFEKKLFNGKGWKGKQTNWLQCSPHCEKQNTINTGIYITCYWCPFSWLGTGKTVSEFASFWLGNEVWTLHLGGKTCSDSSASSLQRIKFE